MVLSASVAVISRRGELNRKNAVLLTACFVVFLLIQSAIERFNI